jgi:hypothetical protein
LSLRIAAAFGASKCRERSLASRLSAAASRINALVGDQSLRGVGRWTTSPLIFIAPIRPFLE